MSSCFLARKKLEQLKKQAKHNPASLNNKVRLVEAAIAKSAGKHGKALRKCEESIKLAQEAGYIQELALACELGG